MTKLLNNIPDDFELVNKNYYQNIEDYDWVKITDNFIGLESFFHYLRQKSFIKELTKTQAVVGQTVLDAGCGTGLLTRHLPPTTIGVDLNPRHIAKAKINVPGVNFLVADLENLPFAAETFSFIVCTEVIEHFPAPEKALRELKRVLKKDGYLLGTVPRASIFWRFRFLSSTRPKEPYHHYFQEAELKTLLEKHFQICKLEKINFHSTLLFLLKNK